MAISEVMHLTAKEVIHLRGWVTQCQANKRAHNVTDRKYTESMGFRGIMLMGKAGEVIAGRYYGVEPDWEIYIGSDGGHDIEIHQKTTEIKTSTRRALIINDPTCKYGTWKPHTEICMLVHCNQSPDQLENIGTDTAFQIIGAVTRTEFFRTAMPTDYGHGPRLVLTEHRLHGTEIFATT